MQPGDPGLDPVYVVFSNQESPGGPVRTFGPYSNVEIQAESISGYGCAGRFLLARWTGCLWVLNEGGGEAFSDVEVVSHSGKTTCGEREQRHRKGQ